MAKTSAALSEESRFGPRGAPEASHAGAAAEGDGDTPRGTMAVLLVYAGILVFMWGYTYVSMLLRR